MDQGKPEGGGRGKSAKADAKAVEAALAAGAARLPEVPLPVGRQDHATAGGLCRPWMVYGERLESRNLVEDVGTILWEGGEKTTSELKREIVALIDRTDSLVALLDLKAGERPGDPKWWPSLSVVMAWMEEDPFFAKAIERWSHARQQRILERVIWDLNSPRPVEMSKAEFALLKERVKFAGGVLPRIVNRGMREKVDVETTNNHLHLHQGLSDEAIEAKLQELRRNPRVLGMLKLPGDDGTSGPLQAAGSEPEGVVMPPMLPISAATPAFRDSLELEP